MLANARDELQESVSLAVLDEGYSAFIARAEAVRIVSTGVKLGGRLPAYCSAPRRGCPLTAGGRNTPDPGP
ncbi:hypothetical protein [Paraburkholderia sediminicola]